MGEARRLQYERDENGNGARATLTRTVRKVEGAFVIVDAYLELVSVRHEGGHARMLLAALENTGASQEWGEGSCDLCAVGAVGIAFDGDGVFFRSGIQTDRCRGGEKEEGDLKPAEAGSTSARFSPKTPPRRRRKRC
jgi:hypothetical protein